MREPGQDGILINKWTPYIKLIGTHEETPQEELKSQGKLEIHAQLSIKCRQAREKLNLQGNDGKTRIGHELSSRGEECAHAEE